MICSNFLAFGIDLIQNCHQEWSFERGLSNRAILYIGTL